MSLHLIARPHRNSGYSRWTRAGKHWAGRYRNWTYLHSSKAAVVSGIGWMAVLAIMFA